MQWYQSHIDEIRTIFAEAEAYIHTFPAPLNQRGAAYLHKFNPIHKDSTNNYICYLLPYWIKEISGISQQHCRQLAVANIFVMLYFFIQDDLMDERPTASHEELALANMCYLQFLNTYQKLFPLDSPFWSSYRQYIADWAESVSNEPCSDYFHHNRQAIADKAGPVKLASTGALCLGGKLDLIEKMSAAVDCAILILQMSDDWSDWKDDLAEGSYNCLIAWTRSELGLPDQYIMTEDEVWHAITVRDVFNGYAEQAKVYEYTIREYGIEVPELFQFQQSMIDSICAEAARLQQAKELLMHGGLFYFAPQYR
ncbi:hypothetical protein [Paenibacillus marinisediminis]